MHARDFCKLLKGHLSSGESEHIQQSNSLCEHTRQADLPYWAQRDCQGRYCKWEKFIRLGKENNQVVKQWDRQPHIYSIRICGFTYLLIQAKVAAPLMPINQIDCVLILLVLLPVNILCLFPMVCWVPASLSVCKLLAYTN